MDSRRAFRPEVTPLDARLLLSITARHARRVSESLAADQAAIPTPGNTVYNLATWNSFHRYYVAEAEVHHPRVVFLGDSITYFWENSEGQSIGKAAWDTTIAPLGAENYGIAGDRTQNVLWRVENGEVSGQPKVVVLLVGINNLALGATPEETATGVSAVVSAIHRKAPGAKILLLGLLPNELTTPSESNANVAATDAILARDARSDRFVSYLNLSSKFERSDGTPNPSLYQDGLHPNAAGYAVLANALVGPIKAMLGGQSPS